MKIHEIIWPLFVPFLLDENRKAITIYPFIIYRDYPSEDIREREWVHIDQIRRDGVFTYYRRHIWHHFTSCSRDEYDREAIEKEHDHRKDHK